MWPFLWMWPGMMPILQPSPYRGDDAGAVGPDEPHGLVPRGTRRTLTMSRTGMPSVMQTTSWQPASIASAMASAAPRAGRRCRTCRRRPASRPRRPCRRSGPCSSKRLAAAAGRDAGDDLRAVGDAGAAWSEPNSPVMPWKTTLVSLLTRMLIGRLSQLRTAAATIFCAPSAIESRRLDGEPALGEDLLALLDVGALEPDDERHLRARAPSPRRRRPRRRRRSA